ncbi:MAG TPA: MraY family glycosyltransferase [Actinomycetota bacterium]|jgi:UDP-GlcNAc:undecaprenyl-phosphate GlcNAc-1-phosphate transferase
MGAYLGVFAVTAGVVVVATPLVRKLAIRVKAIDVPSERKIHTRPLPTMGGLAMLLGVTAGLVAAWFAPSLRPAFRFSSELQGAALAAVAIAIVGAVDDLRTLSAPAKVAGQVFAAGILILNGVALLVFWFPSQGVISLGSDLAVPLTVLWVLIVVNAVNLIDGLDGLAAGIVAIAAAAFFVYAYRVPDVFGQPQSTAAILSAVTAGAAVGFLPFNFSPAKILMGDTGSMLLGLLLAAATISGIGRTGQPTGHDIAAFSIPVLIPVLVLVVPLVDVALAIVRRLRRGRAVFAPDKQHIHHQLREIGHSDRQAVLMMYLWSAVLAGCALAITFVGSRRTASAVLSFAALVIVVTVAPRVWRAVRISREGRAAAAAQAAKPRPRPAGDVAPSEPSSPAGAA